MSGPRWPSGSIPRWDSRPTTTPGPSVRTIRSSIGYQFYVSPHWNLELSAGAGLARLSYHAEPVSGPKRSSYVDSKRFLPIPTEIGVTFVYLFNSKK